MLVLFVILLIILKGISLLNARFINCLANIQQWPSNSRKKASISPKAVLEEQYEFDYAFHSSKEIATLLAKQTEKSPKLVAIHKKLPALGKQQVA